MADDINQTIASFRENLVYKAADQDLIVAINKAIFESQELKEKIDRAGAENKLLWGKGTLEDMARWHPKRARIISNRIFTDVESSVPILTSENPDPAILGELDNNAKERMRKAMQIAYEVKYDMQSKIQRMVRHWFLFRVGVLKYRWVEGKGYSTENVIPRKIGMDKTATSLQDCEYIWEELSDTLENLQKKFPKKKTELEQFASGKNIKTKIRYLEFWGGGGEWVVWKIRDVILDKIKNPNFDYENKENNIFEQPKFPYLFLNVFNIGDQNGLYDDISIVEEASSLQAGLNKLEQQILDLNEGQKRVWVASGEVISEAKAQSLVNKTGDLLVYTDRKYIPNAITQVQSGKPDASLFGHVTHILNEIDNVFGIHSTTRGERTGIKTKGESQLLLGSDRGRLDLISRNIEQVEEEWFNAYLHMLKVYGTEGEILENEQNRIELRSENIPSKIRIMVKRGSTMPIDENSKRQSAVQLAQFGMIDPKTLFEELDYSNADQRTRDLYEWLAATGKINMDALQAIQGGEGGNDQQRLQQVQRLKQIMQQSRQLSPEEQMQVAQQVEEAAAQI